MAQKKNSKTVKPMPKKKAPEARNQHINKDVVEIGRREVVRIKDGPEIVATSDGPVVSPGQLRQVREVVAQPFLTEEEAIGLGKLVWHEYTGPMAPSNNGRRTIIYTTVVNGRRFMVEAKVFAALKNGGMAEQNG